MMFINLPQEQTVTAFRYLPPQDSRDGIVTHYRISATTDWNHWETLGEASSPTSSTTFPICLNRELPSHPS